MRVLKAAAVYLSIWFVVFGSLYYHAVLLRRIQLWNTEVFNPGLAWIYYSLVWPVTAVAGFALLSPWVWTRMKEGLRFNHRVFWLFAIPAVIILLLPVIYFNVHFDWVREIFRWPWLYEIVANSPLYQAAAGLMIGIGLGLALVIKDERRAGME